MSEYVIEDGIPIPADGRGKHQRVRGRGLSGAIEKLQPSQSLFVADKKQGIVANTARNLRIRNHVPDTAQYTTRKVEGGVRIWRTA
jgi:hypothetical protein